MEKVVEVDSDDTSFDENNYDNKPFIESAVVPI